MNHLSSRFAPPLAVLIAALMASGCSKSGKGYAIPESLCGTAVQPDVLEAVLPDGEELRGGNGDISEGILGEDLFCRLVVDRKIVVSTIAEEADAKSLRPEDWATAVSDSPNASEVDLAIPGTRAVVGSDAVLASAKCDGRWPYLKINVALYGDHLEHSPDGAKKVQAFTKDYIKGLKKQMECTV